MLSPGGASHLAAPHPPRRWRMITAIRRVDLPVDALICSKVLRAYGHRPDGQGRPWLRG